MRALVWMALLGVAACGSTDEPEPEPPLSLVEACAEPPVLRVDALTARLEASGCAGIHLERFTLHGEGEAHLELYTDGDKLLPRITALTDLRLDALQMDGRWWAAGEQEAAWWRQGFQSRSPGGIGPLEEPALDARGVVEFSPQSLAGGPDPAGVGWWAGLVGRAQGGAVFAGALSATQTAFRAAWGADTVHLVWGGLGDPLVLPQGGQVFLDPLWLGIDQDPEALWSSYAERLLARTEAEPSPRALDPVLMIEGTGGLQAALDAIESRPSGRASPEVLLLGPGWEVSPGQWTAPLELPSAAEVAAVILDAGYRPGVWMAPLRVHLDSPLFAVRSGWWVRDAQGELLLDEGHAILDVTEPLAAEWLARQIRNRRQEGYALFWLEGMAAGAMAGVRQGPLSGVQAYRRALEIVREAAEDAVIVAGDAPSLPSVGSVDGWVVGPFEQAGLQILGASLAASRPVSGIGWWPVVHPAEGEGGSGGRVLRVVSGGAPWGADPSAERFDAEVVGLSGQRVALMEPLSLQPPILSRWTFEDGIRALLNVGSEPVELKGPGGRELLSGEEAEEGPRVLPPGHGELWR